MSSAWGRSIRLVILCAAVSTGKAGQNHPLTGAYAPTGPDPQPRLRKKTFPINDLAPRAVWHGLCADDGMETLTRNEAVRPELARLGVEDAALVARCRSGDSTAWTALVKRHQRLVYAIVMRLGLDEHSAADVFQTVFARLVQHLPRIVEPERLQGWIAVTAKREALLQLRRSRRTVSMSREGDDGDDDAPEWEFADSSPLPGDALDELQQQDRLRHALDRLDERSRTLLLLLFRADDDKISYDDVARQMGMSIGSIGPTRARCLEKLRRLMA
jgi:RNA polymerase sigma factor (sigma-70 family)